MSGYAVVFAVAAVITFAATPLVRRFVIRAGVIYEPNDRSVHTTPLPTMGGVAMYVGLVAALAVAYVLPFFAPIQGTSSSAATLVVCTLMLGLGVVDDTRGTTALTKFVSQVFIAGILVLFGEQLTYLWLGPQIQVVALSGNLPVIATIIWAVAIPNAVNLVDGLDGLAAGMVAIASAAFFIFLVRTPGPFGSVSQAALISAVTCGICIGFLPWNFYPAKIFMGDAGSMLLGMLLAIATIEGIGNSFTEPSGGQIAAVAGVIAVPLLILFIPFLDVVLAIVRRTWRGQGIAHADKEHIHHRLIDIGHGHREAVLLMYLWSALVSAGALAVGLIDGRPLIAMILVGAAALFLVTALPRFTARRNGHRHDPPGDPSTGSG
jgi:UDP-GlcNAc:undecaprenyl-phosphate GlcNAc-1-phosphate transferase